MHDLAPRRPPFPEAPTRAAPRILVVEDNLDLAAGLRHNLEIEGYLVEHAEDGPSGLARARDWEPDLLILDVMLPGMDGFEVLRSLREDGFDAPVLILTAKGEEADHVRGFRLDADQYVVKPFRLLELLERVKSMLRRARSRTAPAPDSGVIRFGDIVIDTPSRTVRRAGAIVSLTPKAYELMLTLIARDGAVATRVELLREVWGHRGLVLTRTVDSHIAELRRKLERDPAEPRHFITIWKVGYRFQP